MPQDIIMLGTKYGNILYPSQKLGYHFTSDNLENEKHKLRIV